MDKLEKGDVELKKGNTAFYANMIAKEMGMPKEGLAVIAEVALAMDKVEGSKTQLTPLAESTMKALKNTDENSIALNPMAQVLKTAETYTRTMGDTTNAREVNEQNEKAMRNVNVNVANGLTPQKYVDALESGIAKCGSPQQAQLAAQSEKFALEGGERASLRGAMAANKAAYANERKAFDNDRAGHKIAATAPKLSGI